MKGMKEEETVETEDQQEIVAETEETTDEVVAEEETVEETPIPDIEDDVNALLGGEELSEEFKAKGKTIFEGELLLLVSQKQEQKSKQHTQKLLRKKLLKQEKNFLSVLIHILSTYLKSG